MEDLLELQRFPHAEMGKMTIQQFPILKEIARELDNGESLQGNQIEQAALIQKMARSMHNLMWAHEDEDAARKLYRSEGDISTSDFSVLIHNHNRHMQMARIDLLAENLTGGQAHTTGWDTTGLSETLKEMEESKQSYQKNEVQKEGKRWQQSFNEAVRTQPMIAKIQPYNQESVHDAVEQSISIMEESFNVYAQLYDMIQWQNAKPCNQETCAEFLNDIDRAKTDIVGFTQQYMRQFFEAEMPEMLAPEPETADA